jgi:hypothetical protein
MIYFYFTILFLTWYSFHSTKINTDNVLKLAGLGLLSLGSIVSIACLYKPCAEHYYLIESGAIFYLLSDAQHAYFRKYNERKTDKATA